MSVLIRGAGELATAAAVSLQKCGFDLVMTELSSPLAIRRTVSLCEAMFTGTWEVEGVTAVASGPDDVSPLLDDGRIPLLSDRPLPYEEFTPRVLVDGRMLKSHQPDMRSLAELTIGLGPGFIAGGNCHLVIETMRGHDLGRVIHSGSAMGNTGVPGRIAGESIRRVVRAPSDGKITWQVAIGDGVSENDRLGLQSGHTAVIAPLTGMVRGLIAPGIAVAKGTKIADIDPRGNTVNYHSISDKARAVGRGVLEAVLEAGILPGREYGS